MIAQRRIDRHAALEDDPAVPLARGDRLAQQLDVDDTLLAGGGLGRGIGDPERANDAVDLHPLRDDLEHGADLDRRGKLGRADAPDALMFVKHSMGR